MLEISLARSILTTFDESVIFPPLSARLVPCVNGQKSALGTACARQTTLLTIHLSCSFSNSRQLVGSRRKVCSMLRTSRVPYRVHPSQITMGNLYTK
jgi:hypothetical protein